MTIPNRVVLAPLAGIGNWFVRLQAKRYGAGLAVSEMVSSFAIHYGNQKKHEELLRERLFQFLRRGRVEQDLTTLVELNQLRPTDGGLNARAAESIHREGRHLDGHAGLERNVPGAVDGVTAGLQHVANHRVIDPFGLDARFLKRRA